MTVRQRVRAVPGEVCALAAAQARGSGANRVIHTTTTENLLGIDWPLDKALHAIATAEWFAWVPSIDGHDLMVRMPDDSLRYFQVALP